MSRERSQFSRIARVIVLGFLVLWLTGHAFNAHERMLLGTRTFALAMVDRALLLGELVVAHGAAGQQEIDDLLTAFSAPGNQVELSDTAPHISSKQWNHADEINAAVAAALEAGGPSDFRVAFPMARRAEQELPRGPYVLIAIQLPDERWLTSTATTGTMEWGWRHVAASWSTLLMVLVLVAVLWAARRTTRHLPRFAFAAEQLGSRVDMPPLQETGPREVRRAVRAFNRMQSRIREHSEERTAMLAAVSHDLRTYLTRLELRAEAINDAEQRAKTRQDLSEMNQMLEELLQFAREDRHDLQTVPLELRSLLESLVDEHHDLGHDATLAPGEKVTLEGDPIALKRAVNNLVDNAIRYGNRAALELTQSGARAVLTIDDAGPGIAAEHRDTVLAPFQRLETSRNRATGGSGLGLTIARTILDKHGGNLELLEAPGGGLRARVTLPTSS